MQLPDWAQRTRARVEEARAWGERTIFWRVWQRMLENEFIDRSVALAAKAFVSFFPALIVVAAFTPSSVHRSIISTITHRAGVSGPGLSTVKSAFATSDSVRKATGVFGLVLTFFFVNSFTAALCRVYTKAWRRPAGGRVSAYAIGASWFLGICVYFALIGVARQLIGDGPQIAAFGLLAWAATIGLWWITPWFMLQRQVRLRVLATSALATGTALTVYGATASLWMPYTVTQNQQQFGFFGVALAMVTWLTGGALIIVIGACAGPIFAEDPGAIGRLVRGADSAPILADGAAPSLPAPILAPTFANALGARRGTESDDTP